MFEYNTKELCKFEFYNNDAIYQRVYAIVSAENRLPSACEIRVITDDLSAQIETALGFAVRKANMIWFRHIPPEPETFAHELIHLAQKRGGIYEEFYAYNLAPFVVYLAEHNIVPNVNPLRLFEDISISDLADAICNVTGICERDPKEVIREYFQLSGVIPIIMELKTTTEGVTFEFRPELNDKYITVYTIAEVLASVDLSKTNREIAFKLLEKLEQLK